MWDRFYYVYFITGLAFDGLDEVYSTYSRLGILIGSTLAAFLGYFMLRVVLPKQKELT